MICCKKPLLSGTATLLLASFIAGCQTEKIKQPTEPIAGDLKVSMTQQTYYQNYGDLIDARFPELNVVFPTKPLDFPGKPYYEALTDMLDRDKPDLIMVSSPDTLSQLLKDGRLLSLDNFIKRDKFDLNAFLPASVTALQLEGGGKLFGLAPTFDNRTLVYNKALFDRFQIPYPTDGMSWEEILKLGDKFLGKTTEAGAPILGFHEKYMSMMDASYFVNMIANTNGLISIDPQGKTIFPDPDGWRQTLHMIFDRYLSGALAPPNGVKIENGLYGPEQFKASDLFKAGRAAMTLETSSILFDSSKLDFPIGAVASPINKAYPDTTSSLILNQIFAINAKAEHPEAAWEVLKFIMSDETARINAQASSVMPTRLNRLKELGPDFAPFYKLSKFNPTTLPYNYRPPVPAETLQAFGKLQKEEWNAVLEGQETVDDAIQRVITRGQQLLDEANQAPSPSPK